MTLSEIAVVWLPVLERFKPNPMSMPMASVVRLGALVEAIEKHGKSDMAKKIGVVMLATMPIPEQPCPPGTEKVVAYLVDAIEAEMRSWLE